MFNFPWMKKKEKVMPESVKQADKLLPDIVKNLSIPDLQKKINLMGRPNKWALTRRAAQGMQKSTHGGNHYPPNQSEKMRQKRLRQIAKGIIQVTPDREYKSSKQQPVAIQEET